MIHERILKERTAYRSGYGTEPSQVWLDRRSLARLGEELEDLVGLAVSDLVVIYGLEVHVLAGEGEATVVNVC